MKTVSRNFSVSTVAGWFSGSTKQEPGRDAMALIEKVLIVGGKPYRESVKTKNV
jgi:hypothetical protein